MTFFTWLYEVKQVTTEFISLCIHTLGELNLTNNYISVIIKIALSTVIYKLIINKCYTYLFNEIIVLVLMHC